MGRANDYHPAWLAPDGRIVWGESHREIAADTVGHDNYGDMYAAGYLRLQPGYRRDHLGIEGRGGSITPAMRVTLAQLLRTFKPTKANDNSFVAVDGAGAIETVHSPTGFLKACMASYA
jgi:hypothetical protein